ncbi:MAG: tellurium resistance protein [Rhodobacteraceae bacterium]|jgi:tellurite resistance protein|nr:tellurium resistance protein [Paracoccaceae bacterium]
MSRPPLPPLPPIPPRPGLFRQTPPAAFTPVFGLLGLGLAWRRAAFALPPGAAELLLGAVTLLYLSVVAAYLAKAARRPAVVAEDLRVLPGRSGLTAASLSVFLLAAVAVPYSAPLARTLLFGGLALHALLAVLYIRALLAAPPEQRRATPVWHLAFVGFILAPLSAVPLGYTALSTAILYATIPVAIFIWTLSAVQVARDSVPAPLRPFLAIHVAPAALFATVSASLGLPQMAGAFCLLMLAILALLIGLARWVTAAGFSPLWGAFTFPAAAACSACLAQGEEPFRSLGAALLIGATLMIPTIAWKIMQLWAEGKLGPKTNAAIA